jgi:hypothetical protein
MSQPNIKHLPKEQRKLLSRYIGLSPTLFDQMFFKMGVQTTVTLGYLQSLREPEPITAIFCTAEWGVGNLRFYAYLEYNYTLYECKLKNSQKLSEALKAWAAAEISQFNQAPIIISSKPLSHEY